MKEDENMKCGESHDDEAIEALPGCFPIPIHDSVDVMVDFPGFAYAGSVRAQ
jgi:hypothetical protein